jgi:hypothetical protein
MRRISNTACVTVIFLLGVVSSAAADAEDASAPLTKFSIGAFIGYRAGGQGTDTNTGAHFQLAPAQTYGLVADFRVSPDTEVEVLWSQQNTRVQQTSPVNTQLFDVNVGYYQIGASYLFTNEGVQPFMVATLGATYFSPQQTGYQNETKFSFGIGGGVKVPVGRHFGLRLEARAYGTVLDNNSSAVCTNGSCLIHVSGSLMWQYEANAGVYIAF